MLNEYKDKIELQKEVLAALPRNNNKNNKLYIRIYIRTTHN